MSLSQICRKYDRVLGVVRVLIFTGSIVHRGQRYRNIRSGRSNSISELTTFLQQNDDLKYILKLRLLYCYLSRVMDAELTVIIVLS